MPLPDEVEPFKPPRVRREAVAKHLGISPEHVRDVWKSSTVEGGSKVMAQVEIKEDPFEFGFRATIEQVEKEQQLIDLKDRLATTKKTMDRMIDFWPRLDEKRMFRLKELKAERDDFEKRIKDLEAIG